ncbi:P-loop containing nucleoside triphosphate hydrolase protein [Jackrogersella minutella]|nr:P-loop containing nucleoside triphosphate hydrolase protein [Jackrogersella minutella]
MQLPPYLLPLGASDDMAMYDDLYTQSWQDAIQQCEKTLERHDYIRALQVKSLQDFHNELGRLLVEHPNQPSITAILLIYPSLDHYAAFAQSFVNMMSNPVDTSMMWGLLFLVFKLALASTGSVNPLSQITKWLEKIGHELRHSNDCRDKITDLEKVKRDTVEVNKEIVFLRLNIIMTFRNKGHGHNISLDDSTWAGLKATYNDAYQNISEAIKRIEKVAEMADWHVRTGEISMLQRLLSLKDSLQDDVALPCDNLPVAENGRFFGRQDILQRLDSHLKPANTNSRLSSIALYGLGGIGKTQIALAYAYQRLDDLDTILWISSETSYSIQQSFSHIALGALKLPKATPQAHHENKILVLDWLQKTTSRWLVIFDNVDKHDDLEECWPVSKHGAILVTTRDVLVATLPIDCGLEVTEFDNNEGAKFLLHLTDSRRRTNGELGAAHQVAKELGGLPLAINQMAALVNARNYSIDEFHAIYRKYKQHLHSQKKNGWRYLGYQHGLDTVWELSFTNLGDHARACLGVLSLLSADSIPSEIFTKNTASDKLPKALSFCENALSLGDAVEELTHHALVRKNIAQSSFRIHRLVQAEYRARTDDPQEDFEAAIKLLLEKIPSQRSSKFNNEEWMLYERYIPQVLALAKNYNDSQANPKPLEPTMDFVRLLTYSSNAIHDNDTMHVVPRMIETADCAYHKCTEVEQDRLIWALLLYLKCMHHFCTSEFATSRLASNAIHSTSRPCGLRYL